MSSSNPEVARLESEKKRHQDGLKSIQDKIRREEGDVNHLKTELKRHEDALRQLEVELSKDQAGIQTIESQIHGAKQRAEAEEKLAKQNHR